MPDFAYIDLPPDPKDLTRALALQVFEHPEVFTQEYARLAAQHAHEHTTSAEAVPEGAIHGRG